MDKLNQYRDVVERVLNDYAAIPYSYGNLQRQTVFDRQRDHYLLMTVGWDKSRVHGALVHIDLIDGKLWIQRDGTEEGIAIALEQSGIPKSDIVLAFKPPEIRRQSGYAAV